LDEEINPKVVDVAWLDAATASPRPLARYRMTNVVAASALLLFDSPG